ncbi:MAG: hypothetical protein EKK37_01985 [Sphingobacteriales bacterium]|nr:MAG: hypothetical protein EKK37_01985 [Sphingobacteriales bacterium]
MKKITATFAILVVTSATILSSSAIDAQEHKPIFTKSYVQFMAGKTGTAGSATTIGFQAATKNNWVFSVEKQKLKYESANLPSDYQPSTGVVLFVIPIDGSNPRDKYSAINITGGKLFHTSRTTWITTEAGISFYKAEVVKFTPVEQTSIDPAWLLLGFYSQSSNYNTTSEIKKGTGAILKCDFNWAFSNVTGLGISTFANINGVKSKIGIELKFTLGWMNNATKK